MVKGFLGSTSTTAVPRRCFVKVNIVPSVPISVLFTVSAFLRSMPHGALDVQSPWRGVNHGISMVYPWYIHSGRRQGRQGLPRLRPPDPSDPRLHVVPILLQERHQEVDCHQAVLPAPRGIKLPQKHYHELPWAKMPDVCLGPISSILYIHLYIST